MSIDSTIVMMARAAKAASIQMAKCSSGQKNDVLLNIANRIIDRASHIQGENQKDLSRAKKAGLSNAMIDRLTVTEVTIQSMARGLREVARLNDPVGSITKAWLRPNGLEVSRMRIPLGVIGIIYESRPNVTIDAAGLCLKAGNAVILRGGSEALQSNQALAGIIAQGLRDTGLPGESVQIVPVRDREAVNLLLAQDECIDLIMKIPVLKHYKGVCHIYVDETADVAMAQKICFNAKVQRPGVCNAMETMLVHRAISKKFLPQMAKQLVDAGVEIRGCEETCRILPMAKQADKSDWPEEYLDFILAVKVVKDMDHAMSHIETYSSKHTEAIVTRDYQKARYFVRTVDSGAEIGISTSKLHAFGPMGVEELTTTKFVVYGDGQVRE